MNAERENAERENAEFQASLKEASRPDEVGKKHRRRLNYTLPSLYEIELAKLLWPESKRLLALQVACYHVLNEKPGHWSIAIVRKLDRIVFPELTQGGPLSYESSAARALDLRRFLELTQGKDKDRRKSEQAWLAELTGPELIVAMASSSDDLQEFPGLRSAKPGKPRKDHKRLARLLARMKAMLSPEVFEKVRKGLVGSLINKAILDAVWKTDDLFIVEFGKALQTESRADCGKARIYDFLRRNWDRVEECKTRAAIRCLPGFPCPDYDRPTLYALFREVGLPIAKQ